MEEEGGGFSFWATRGVGRGWGSGTWDSSARRRVRVWNVIQGRDQRVRRTAASLPRGKGSRSLSSAKLHQSRGGKQGKTHTQNKAIQIVVPKMRSLQILYFMTGEYC